MGAIRRPSLHWEKRGLVFSPHGDHGWMHTHAQVPTPLLCDGCIRVYFASRPEQTMSLPTFVDLDVRDPGRILRLNPQPVLEPGRPGTFDEHGVMPSYALRSGDDVFLYYSGWSRGSTVPYSNSTGLAVSRDGGATFERMSDGPILARNRFDPYSATSPCVLKETDGWHMWYCSGTSWLQVNGRYEHTYDIKSAVSEDGVGWVPTGKIAVAQHTPEEALTRPYVVKLHGTYHMWFCQRGSRGFRDGSEAYRIGYAWSEDTENWHRDDEAAGIHPSNDGWDSRMLAYPAVVVVEDQVIMFYNGNDFGRNGFGYSVLSDVTR